MRSPNTKIHPAIESLHWIGATVVAPNGEVEGEINDAVMDATTGKVKYFIVAIGDPQRGSASVFALPFGDCTFDEKRRSCVAKSLYPLRV